VRVRWELGGGKGEVVLKGGEVLVKIGKELLLFVLFFAKRLRITEKKC
jgi:hypothetical protein